MKEIWKSIKGYEGLYEVSNMGEVKSLARPYKNQYGYCGLKPERILKKKIVCFDKTKKLEEGYYAVNLCNKDRGKWKRLHIIVAQTFIENKQNKKEVNHKNGNKLDNRVENLEWVTHQENCQHAWDIGLNGQNEERRREKIKIKNQRLKRISKDIVLKIYKDYENGIKNLHKLSRDYNVSVQTVSNIIHKTNATYKNIIEKTGV